MALYTLEIECRVVALQAKLGLMVGFRADDVQDTVDAIVDGFRGISALATAIDKLGESKIADVQTIMDQSYSLKDEYMFDLWSQVVRKLEKKASQDDASRLPPILP